jgi:hypothetical protein
MERNLLPYNRDRRAEGEAMTIGIQFKEIYIHLTENEPGLVCTVRYGGLIGRSTHFPLEIGREVPPDLDEESLPVVRIRNRRRDSLQGGC